VLTETARYAGVVFAAASFAEKRGHVTNLEGRRQEFRQAVEPPLQVKTDSDILAALARAMGRTDQALDDVDALFVRLTNAQNNARRAGAPLSRPKVESGMLRAGGESEHGNLKIIPVPRLYAGGGAAATDPGLAPMRPKPFAMLHPDDAARYHLAEDDRVALSGRGGTIEVWVRIGTQAPAGTALVLADMPEAPVNRLLDLSGYGRASLKKLSSAETRSASEELSA